MPIRPGCYGHKPGQGKIPFGSLMSMGPMLNALEVIPPIINLHQPEWISPCYDQGQTNACVLHMWAAITEYGLRRTPALPKFTPSRLFGYWNVRDIEGDTDQDGGSFCHDAWHQGNYVGIIPETDYPFSDDPKIVLAKPPDNLFVEAEKIRLPNFAPLNNANILQLKTCLAHGFPFGGGFQVPANFQTQAFSDNPVLTLNGRSLKIVGGHGVATFESDDTKQTADGVGAFKLRNSWGTDWGEDGMFWVSYEFMASNMFSDMWMGRFPGQQTSLITA
jgi:C1A family cysteine protease